MVREALQGASEEYFGIAEALLGRFGGGTKQQKRGVKAVWGGRNVGSI